MKGFFTASTRRTGQPRFNHKGRTTRPANRRVTVSLEDRTRILRSLLTLPVAPEVPESLKRWRAAGFRMVTLTNSSPTAAKAQVENSARIEPSHTGVCCGTVQGRFRSINRRFNSEIQVDFDFPFVIASSSEKTFNPKTKSWGVTLVEIVSGPGVFRTALLYSGRPPKAISSHEIPLVSEHSPNNEEIFDGPGTRARGPFAVCANFTP
jgi:hypothetical protein